MRIGISITSFYPGVEPRVGAGWMVERAKAAAASGLDSLFVGDHHATAQPYFQNTPMLGRLLAEWNDRPFGALYLLPLWHPVLLAEQTATLASLAAGPFVLQCGLGAGERQFSAFGVPLRERRGRFEESIGLLRRLWSGEEISSTGMWQFERARVSPQPPAVPQIWVGASAEAAIERAARIGDGWIASPHLRPEEARRQIDFYRDRCEAFGRRGVASIRADVLVASNDAAAAAAARPVLDGGYRGFPEEALIVGGPERVAERARDLAEIGYEELLVRNLASDQGTALASIEALSSVRSLVSAEVPCP